MHLRAFILGAGLIMVAAGCGSDDAPTSEGGTDQAELSGTMWRLLTVGGGEAVVGSTVSLDFGDDGEANGTTGCNQFNAQYEVNGADLAFGAIAATAAACVDPAMSAQESAFLQALESTGRFSIEEDTLRLDDSDGNALATFAAFASDVIGTSWEVISVNNGNEAVVSTIIGTELTLAFGEDAMLSGSAGCNSFSGAYALSGTEIAIGPLSSTRKACAEPDGIMAQEQQYLAALETAATFQFAGDRLELRTETGALAVSLSPGS